MGYVALRILIDSHIFLRLDRNPELIPKMHRQAIEDIANEVFVSTITPWELGIKQSTGKLILLESISAQLSRFDFTELPITFAHAEYAAALPYLHRDPFDRMLVAQAIAETWCSSARTKNSTSTPV